MDNAKILEIVRACDKDLRGLYVVTYPGQPIEIIDGDDYNVTADILTIVNAVLSAPTAAGQAAPTPWISVKDRLPTHLHSVLGYVTSGSMTIFGQNPMTDVVAFIPERGVWIQFTGEGDDEEVTVTHWMPLPDAPSIDANPEKGPTK